MVSTITRTSDVAGSAQIRRVASTPSISGIRMSIRTTSGTSSCAMATAAVAVGRLADDLDVVGRVHEHAQPASH